MYVIIRPSDLLTKVCVKMNMWLLYIVLFILIIIIATQFKVVHNIFGGDSVFHRYTKFIPDFCHKTNPDYKNCEERNLNTIETGDSTEYEYIKLKREAQHPENVKNYIEPNGDFLADLRDDKNVRVVTGFYNIEIPYGHAPSDNQLTKASLAEGTYVTAANINKVFKEPIDKLQDKNAIVSWSKGAGRKNMQKVAQKLQSEGVKWLMLDAAGTEILKKIYESYGFKMLLNGYKKNVIEDEWGSSSNYFMYGTIDNIIANTR